MLDYIHDGMINMGWVGGFGGEGGRRVKSVSRSGSVCENVKEGSKGKKRRKEERRTHSEKIFRHIWIESQKNLTHITLDITLLYFTLHRDHFSSSDIFLSFSFWGLLRSIFMSMSMCSRCAKQVKSSQAKQASV
jgi:hypothetical protein